LIGAKERLHGLSRLSIRLLKEVRLHRFSIKRAKLNLVPVSRNAIHVIEILTISWEAHKVKDQGTSTINTTFHNSAITKEDNGDDGDDGSLSHVHTSR
jgi:hypothetical protein